MLKAPSSAPTNSGCASGAVSGRLCQRPIQERAAAHFKATGADGTFDVQLGQVHDERLQQEHAL
jgi:hypothetical protein